MWAAEYHTPSGGGVPSRVPGPSSRRPGKSSFRTSEGPSPGERPRSCRTYAWCFFFQAEDGIRDGRVTGVQTCALPIWSVRESTRARRLTVRVFHTGRVEVVVPSRTSPRAVQRFLERHRSWIERKRDEARRKIGRASCRERV